MIIKLTNYKKILGVSIFGLIFLVVPLKVHAAIISIKTPTDATVGSRISVDILVDPESQSINSVQSTVNFSNEFLVFNGFSVKQSSIPIWVEEPKEKQKGSINFSGVIPGGLERLYDPVNTSNKSIPVVRLFFITKSPGYTTLFTNNSLILKNDGKGTEASIKEDTTSLSIISGSKDDGVGSKLLEDITPPNPFTITFIERSVFGKTPRLAIFNAEDNEGGIDRYEVGVGNLGFSKATSPFSLPYRLFSYTLTVKAFDYTGNVREQQVVIPGESPYGLGFAILLLSIVLGIIRYRYIKSKKT